MFGLPFNFGPIAGPYFPPAAVCEQIVEPAKTFHPYGGAEMPNPFSADCSGSPEPEETIFDRFSNPQTSTSSKYPRQNYTVVLYDDFENQVAEVELLACGGSNINLTGACGEKTIADVRMVYRLNQGRVIVEFIGGRRGQVSTFPFRFILTNGKYILHNATIQIAED